MANIKAGWHKLSGRDVFVDDNGQIVRGTKHTSNGDVTAYVYRYSKDCRAWIKEEKITPSAFCAGVKRGTIDLK